VKLPRDTCCLIDERAEAPSIGIDRNVIVYEHVVQLEAVGFLKLPFEKIPWDLELDGMFESSLGLRKSRETASRAWI
jgi:hypothetical protein